MDDACIYIVRNAEGHIVASFRTAEKADTYAHAHEGYTVTVETEATYTGD